MSNLIVVSVVLAGAAILTGGLSNLLVVLAGAAILTGGLSNFLVVLAGAAIVASGNVIVNSRSILSNWAICTHC